MSRKKLRPSKLHAEGKASRDNPDWEPEFHDAELRKAYEETRHIFEAARDRAVWEEPRP